MNSRQIQKRHERYAKTLFLTKRISASEYAGLLWGWLVYRPHFNDIIDPVYWRKGQYSRRKGIK